MVVIHAGHGPIPVGICSFCLAVLKALLRIRIDRAPPVVSRVALPAVGTPRRFGPCLLALGSRVVVGAFKAFWFLGTEGGRVPEALTAVALDRTAWGVVIVH
jgi:hypothetical protein